MGSAEPDRRSSFESDEGIDRSFGEFECSTERTKIFSDNVHSQLELPKICSKFINTAQFQRLRNLKQLGLCYFVYPSGAHNRFEHCMGTSFLAGKYVEILRKNQPELDITEVDIKCLYLAGLCHDLGHGPYSHMWEKFMHEIGNKDYAHEIMSLRLFDALIDKNNLKEELKAESIDENELVFIKECIYGQPLPGNEDFVGRKPAKHFLYQIVSNGLTKIDVDKFDYILRDCKHLNVTTAFDYQRLMNNSRVVAYREDDGVTCDIGEDESVPTRIVYRKKIQSTLEDLFRSRFSLHQKAYQHRVTMIIEEMVSDALHAAEDHFKVPGDNDIIYKLSTAYKDTSAFIKLTDSLFERFYLWGDGGPHAAKLFGDVMQRKLYDFLGSFSGKIEESARNELKKKDENIRFISSKINFGCGQKNPLNYALFFEKSRPNRLLQLEFGDAPEVTRTFIVYCTAARNKSRNGNEPVSWDVILKTAKQSVNRWADRNGIELEFE